MRHSIVQLCRLCSLHIPTGGYASHSTHAANIQNMFHELSSCGWQALEYYTVAAKCLVHAYMWWDSIKYKFNLAYLISQKKTQNTNVECLFLSL